MKRSEAIITIAKIIKNDIATRFPPQKGSSYCEVINISEAYKLAKIALEAVESIGMIPPAIIKTFNEERYMGKITNEWEQE